jgi:N4-gp56 family major capsid protein
MAANTLATVLDDAGGRALVEKYLEKKFLERRDYDTVLANSQFATSFRIPSGSGNYLEATRKGRFRMPQNVSNSNPTADPASGASMSVEKVKFPLEAIQEYIEIGTITTWVSWIDLDEWADEDLRKALMRGMHRRTQAAFMVGRYQPGVWGSDGNASTAFESAAEATPTIEGVSFSFAAAPRYYPGGKTAFASLNPNDRIRFSDLNRIQTRFANSGVEKLSAGGNSGYVCVLSEALKNDLMQDDEYFRAAIHAFGGKGLRENQLTFYRGWHFYLDDEPFTLTSASATVRATSGDIHAAFCMGRGAFAYLKLGGKDSMRPKFKVQDITKTGVAYTIGYTVPFQVAIVNAEYCAALVSPVSEWAVNQ